MPLLYSSTLTLATSLFFFFTCFKTFQSLYLGVRFRVSVWISIRVRFRVSVRVSIRAGVRAIFRVSVRQGLQLGSMLRLGLGFIFYVYFISAKPVAAGILAAK